MSFDGLTLLPGAVDASANTTGVFTAEQQLPSFLASHPERAAILDAITDGASTLLAPYDIDVVRERPADATYMLVAFTTASESIGLASGQYGIATPACNVTTSKTISFNFESPDVTAMPAEFIANLYAYQTVAEIGIAYGVPMASAPVANCMCWTASNCFAQGIGPYGSACTMGTATVDPTSPCKTTDMFDVAATFEARLGARPD